MPVEKGQRLKLLKIWEILRQETDEAHPMSSVELLKRLEDIDIKCDRRTLYADIQALDESGYKINCVRRKTNEYFVEHQSNIIRIVYSSRVSGSDLLFILKICNKKRELADFTPQALVPFLSVSNGKPFRFRPQWRYPCVNQWDHSYLIFY